MRFLGTLKEIRLVQPKNASVSIFSTESGILTETIEELSDITNINYKYQENKDKIEQIEKEIINLNTNNSSNEAKSSSYKLQIIELDKNIKELQSELLIMTSNVEKINAKKQIILERKKYEVENTKLHDSLIKLKEDQFNLNNNIKLYNNEI